MTCQPVVFHCDYADFVHLKIARLKEKTVRAERQLQPDPGVYVIFPGQKVKIYESKYSTFVRNVIPRRALTCKFHRISPVTKLPTFKSFVSSRLLVFFSPFPFRLFFPFLSPACENLWIFFPFFSSFFFSKYRISFATLQRA